MRASILIHSTNSDDFIQADLLKCMFILRHRQKNQQVNADPIAIAKWAVFWETISRFSFSMVHDNQEVECYDFLSNSLIEHDDLIHWENNSFGTEVSINRSKWLPLHCSAFNSTISDEHTKVLSLACVKVGGKETENYQASKTEETPLHLAASSDNLNIKTVRQLLKYFPRMVHAKTNSGQIPLHYAAKYSSNVEIVEILIQAYPKGLREKCSKGDVPLCNACRNCSEGNIEIIEKLLQACPDSVKRFNNNGEMPLHVAVSQQCIYSSSRLLDIIKILLTAYPEAAMTPDIKGNTPLHRLCGNEDITEINSIVELFLEICPAAASALNNDGQNPLHTLLRGGNGEGKDLNNLVSILLDVYPEVLAVSDEYGCFPIHYAVMSDLNLSNIERIIDGHPAALLSLGHQYNFKDMLTPLQLSLRGYKDVPESESCDRLTLVKYLYSRCPESIHIRSGSNDTTLYTAVRYCLDSNKNQIVKAVYDMDPSAAMSVNSNGETPLHRAIKMALHHPQGPFHDPSHFRFLLNMCPVAVSVCDFHSVSPLIEVKKYKRNQYGKWRIERGEILHRIFLQAMPGNDRKELCRLNYEARRMAMFVFYSAIFEDNNENEDDKDYDYDDNIFVKLRTSYPYIARAIILFL